MEGVVEELSQIDAVGHRVVHGGETFAKPALVDGAVIRAIEELSELAVLHNPITLAGIRAVSDLMPGVPQVAVFDTAFFTSIPSHAFIYAVPYAWYEKYRIRRYRRYGSHGTSHRFVARRAAVLLGKPEYAVNLITLHIGNGVSITAVKRRKGVWSQHGLYSSGGERHGNALWRYRSKHTSLRDEKGEHSA